MWGQGTAAQTTSRNTRKTAVQPGCPVFQVLVLFFVFLDHFLLGSLQTFLSLHVRIKLIVIKYLVILLSVVNVPHQFSHFSWYLELCSFPPKYLLSSSPPQDYRLSYAQYISTLFQVFNKSTDQNWPGSHSCVIPLVKPWIIRHWKLLTKSKFSINCVL